MSDLSSFFGPNAGYVMGLYEAYEKDPLLVDPEMRSFFENFVSSQSDIKSSVSSLVGESTPHSFDVTKVVAAARVARLVRELGHRTAHIDPLGSPPPGDPGLELSTHGLVTEDLIALPAKVVGGPLSVGAANALEALGNLRRAYSGSIGYEDDHIQNDEERTWLVTAIETRKFFVELSDVEKKELLVRLTEVETFETYLDKAFDKQKRFSIEGMDMLVPVLDLVIRQAAANGTHEIVMGMAHRGRLNVLAHILGKGYRAILSEFQSGKLEEKNSVAGAGTSGWTGDVKYHLGAERAYTEGVKDAMPITLAPNPSHLEFVDPVVIGRARAAQERRDQPGEPKRDYTASLAILIHGDAAFPGQGIVPETLNMSQLHGYSVGGTIHIITNNQIGFTTGPQDSRSTLYASDLAKGFEIPIVHVNADDPVACLAAARMAHAYRERFRKDFLIDLVGYRRWGHNEGDEPSFTQPQMYQKIQSHPTVREQWARTLEKQGVIARDEAIAMTAKVTVALDEARAAGSGKGLQKAVSTVETATTKFDTAISGSALADLNESLLARPEGFTANAKLDRQIFAKRRSGLVDNAINWSHAEALAFASILADGVAIRLTGQDSERGTFNQRHLVLHDPTTGEQFNPMTVLPQAKASFAVYNSPLSENAVLGFEYGYSMHAAKTLVIWEAQFGDFVNGAQVIIDQFIVSGRAKWRQTPSLVLLLPHGYEGQGPEHSSARLERFLQLASGDNIRVVNCTDASQYFHVLRRQAYLTTEAPRPLIIMAPKSLLKSPLNASPLVAFTSGTFQPVIQDKNALTRHAEITRVVLCTGKVYFDIVKSESYTSSTGTAVIRIEELHPFPSTEVKNALEAFENLSEVAWVQEEPSNMGAYTYIAPYLRAIVSPTIEIRYFGRPSSASPAEGSAKRHAIEQGRIVSAALSGVPEVPKKRSTVTNAR